MAVVVKPINGVIKALIMSGSTSIKPNGDETIVSVGLIGHLKASINFFLTSLNMVFIFLVLVSKTDFKLDFDFISRQVGVSLFDVVCFTMPVASTLIAAVTMYIYVLKKRHKWQDLYLSTARIIYKYGIEPDAIGQWSKNATLKIFKKPLFEMLLSCIFYTVSNYYMCRRIAGNDTNGLTEYLVWPTTITSSLGVIFGMCNPILLGAIFFKFYLIFYICGLYKDFARIVRTTALGKLKMKGKVTTVIDGEPDRKIEDIIDYGLDICHLGKQMNTVCDSPFIIVFIDLLLTLVCCLYGITTIFFHPIGVMILNLALTFTFWSFGIGHFIGNLCSAGQTLEDVRREAKYSLQNLRRAIQYSVKEKVSSDMNLLLDRLGEPDALAPKQFFAINHSTYLGMTSAIFTYLIVLTQFKASEKT